MKYAKYLVEIFAKSQPFDLGQWSPFVRAGKFGGGFCLSRAICHLYVLGSGCKTMRERHRSLIVSNKTTFVVAAKK